MKKQKILFVSHCIFNTAAKVCRSMPIEKTNEEISRKDFLVKAICADIQFIQLPCPEFTLYGPHRWGHMQSQFDNPFFREHCKVSLAPIFLQMQAYLEVPERFDVLGIVGINGSPSCGVTRTCKGPWGGEFSGRTDLETVLSSVVSASESGVLIDVLKSEMNRLEIKLPIMALDGRNPDAMKGLLEKVEGAHEN